VGLRATQFTILQVLTLAAEVTQSQLSEMFVIDSTTLSRTLRIMAREGWIAERRGKDRRERWLRLTRSGEAHFKRALPAWERSKRACVVSWENPPGITFWKSHIRSRTW
jgi:DNA-binding MarR family transcriptional regulator